MQFRPAENPWAANAMKHVARGDLFFVKKVGKCLYGNCRHAGHLPHCYQEYADFEWILSWNRRQLCNRLPSEWVCTESYDHAAYAWFEPPNGFREMHIHDYGRLPLFVKNDISTKEVNRLWHGCPLLGITGTNYEYVGRTDATFEGVKTVHNPPTVCSLKDICISDLLEDSNFEGDHFQRGAYLKIASDLTTDLKMEIQKRACPWKQVKMGCFDAVRTWHPNGQLCQEIPLNGQNQYHGNAVMCDRKGRKMMSVHFNNGKQHGPCTTWTHAWEWADRPISIASFKNGVPDGKRIRHESVFGYDKKTSMGRFAYEIAEEEVFGPGRCLHQIYSTVTFPHAHIKHTWKLYGRTKRKSGWTVVTYTDPKERDMIHDRDLKLLHLDRNENPFPLFYCECEIKRIEAEAAARKEKEKEKGPVRKKQRI